MCAVWDDEELWSPTFKPNGHPRPTTKHLPHQPPHPNRQQPQTTHPQEETTFWKLVKQRMRWCKGHWQVFESRQNPLLLPGMALRQRFLFAYTGVISYIATMIAIPANSVLPLLALAGGVFPFLVDT